MLWFPNGNSIGSIAHDTDFLMVNLCLLLGRALSMPPITVCRVCSSPTARTSVYVSYFLEGKSMWCIFHMWISLWAECGLCSVLSPTWEESFWRFCRFFLVKKTKPKNRKVPKEIQLKRPILIVTTLLSIPEWYNGLHSSCGELGRVHCRKCTWYWYTVVCRHVHRQDLIVKFSIGIITLKPRRSDWQIGNVSVTVVTSVPWAGIKCLFYTCMSGGVVHANSTRLFSLAFFEISGAPKCNSNQDVLKFDHDHSSFVPFQSFTFYLHLRSLLQEMRVTYATETFFFSSLNLNAI